MTLRVLADGAWGVHSTTDLASLNDQIDPPLVLPRRLRNAAHPANAPKRSPRSP